MDEMISEQISVMLYCQLENKDKIVEDFWIRIQLLQ